MTDKAPLPEGLVTKFAPLGSIEVQADAPGHIKGIASRFGVPDFAKDVMIPGCFDGSLARHRAAGTMPFMPWNHDWDGVPIGLWTAAVVDDAALTLEGQLIIEVGEGARVYPLLKAGSAVGLSVGFMPIRSVPILDAAGRTVGREYHEVDLVEVSLVNRACMPGAAVTAVKSADPPAAPGGGIDPVKQPRLLKAMAQLAEVSPPAG
jgi:HK97 family phage prohead protease